MIIKVHFLCLYCCCFFYYLHIHTHGLIHLQWDVANTCCLRNEMICCLSQGKRVTEVARVWNCLNTTILQINILFSAFVCLFIFFFFLFCKLFNAWISFFTSWLFSFVFFFVFFYIFIASHKPSSRCVFTALFQFFSL